MNTHIKAGNAGPPLRRVPLVFLWTASVLVGCIGKDVVVRTETRDTLVRPYVEDEQEEIAFVAAVNGVPVARPSDVVDATSRVEVEVTKLRTCLKRAHQVVDRTEFTIREQPGAAIEVELVFAALGAAALGTGLGLHYGANEPVSLDNPTATTWLTYGGGTTLSLSGIALIIDAYAVRDSSEPIGRVDVAGEVTRSRCGTEPVVGTEVSIDRPAIASAMTDGAGRAVLDIGAAVGQQHQLLLGDTRVAILDIGGVIKARAKVKVALTAIADESAAKWIDANPACDSLPTLNDDERALCRKESTDAARGSFERSINDALTACVTRYVDSGGQSKRECELTPKPETTFDQALISKRKEACSASCKKEATRSLAAARAEAKERARPQSKSEQCQANCRVRGTICVSGCLDGDQDCALRCVTERNSCWGGCGGGSSAVQASSSGPRREGSGSSAGLSCARGCAERTDACRSRCRGDLQCEAACADRGTKCVERCD